MRLLDQVQSIPQKLFLIILTTLSILTSCTKEEALPSTNEDLIDTEVGSEPEDTSSTETEVPTTGPVLFEANFTLDESRTVFNYVLSETEYNKFITGEGDLKLITEKVYDYIEDDFDFIIILSIEDVQPSGLFYGRSTLIQNQIQGLGINTYSNATDYGSAERLKNVIYMPRSEYVRNGPFLHEIAHTWGNKGFIPTDVGGHWGYASTAGQLGGFDELIDLGNDLYKGRLNNNDGFGTFANGGNSIPYGNLELYLMGLIDASELEDIQVAVNPEWGQNTGEFTADEIVTHSAQSLIADHGARLPAFSDAQTSFKALSVIISTADLSAAKLDQIKLDLDNFSRSSAPDASWGTTNNFWMATQGKASFKFEIVQENIK